MSDFEGKIRAVTSYGDVPLDSSPQTILAMFDFTNNSQNTMSDIFSQSNTQIHQSEQKYGSFGERLGSRIEFELPPLDTKNISPFAAFFRAGPIVPSPPISPGFSPSTFLQSPNMLSDSSQIPPILNFDNRPPEMINEGFNEGHAMEMLSNNNVPYQQPMHGYVPPQQAEELVNVLSHESHVKPIGVSMESGIDGNIISMLEESKDKGNEEDEDRDIVDIDVEENKNEDRKIIDLDEYEEKHRDQYIINVDELDDNEYSSKKRRLHDQGSHFEATRKKKQPRVIIQMETEENNPDDGFRWRKYGHKVLKGTLKPRSYYKCTYSGCKVKKHVERGTKNKNLLVITYDGKHEHHTPPPRNFDPRNLNSSSQLTIDQSNHRLGKRPFTSSPREDTRTHFTCLGPQKDMEQSYMAGVSELSSLHQDDRLVNHNSGFMHHNDDCQPVNQNSSLMSRNDQLVNQRDLSFTCWKSQKIDPNPGFASQEDYSVNLNPGFLKP